MESLVAEYLKERKAKLGELYQWDFDIEIPKKKFGVTFTGKTWLERTNELKTFLCWRIEADKSPENHAEIATYFIKEWGGIKRFSKAQEVVGQFSNIAGTEVAPEDCKPKFTSISSWSKWGSLVCPKWACIYDTRVAYSLNAINYINGGRHRIFPMPDGRNSRLIILDVSTLLLSSKIQAGDENDPKKLGEKYFVSKSSAYKEYLSMVRGVSHALWNDYEHIHEVEMLLFALADTSIYESVFSSLQRTGASAHR
jgi:hypothetical protein